MLLEVDANLGSLFYLSGPGEMIPEMEEVLRSMGVPDDQIRYEVWWKPSHDPV
jgi:ferredoxin-NADP reductase